MGSVNSTLTMPFIPYTVLTCDVTVHALKKKNKIKTKQNKTCLQTHANVMSITFFQ